MQFRVRIRVDATNGNDDVRAGLMGFTFLWREPAPHSGLEYVLQRFYTFSQRVCLYGDIPGMHQRKTDSFRRVDEALEVSQLLADVCWWWH